MKTKAILFSLVLLFSPFLLVANELIFAANKGQIKIPDGQVATEVLFYIQQHQTTLFLTKTGLKYTFLPAPTVDPKSQEAALYDVAWTLKNCNPNAVVSIEEQDDFFINYYDPNYPTGVLHIPHCKVVRYQDIYPNIDWVIYTHATGIKYDFVVHPGGNPADIVFEIEGASTINITPSATLRIATPIGDIQEQAPYLYQKVAGVEQTILGGFRLQDQHLSFEVGSYDPQETLVIDPFLTWGTFYGGNYAQERFIANAIDDNDNMVAIGNLKITPFQSTVFPTYNPGNGAYFSGGTTANSTGIITKFDKNGRRLWASYLYINPFGGLHNVATDSRGNVYVLASTNQTNGTFTLVDPGNGAYFQPTSKGGNSEVIIFRFDANANLTWSTNFGSAGNESAYGMAVDENDHLYIGGGHGSLDARNYIGADFPTKWKAGAYNDTLYTDNGPPGSFFGSVMFIAEFDPNANLQWSTFYGISSLSHLAFNPRGELVAAGYVPGVLNFPTYDPTGGAGTIHFEDCSSGCVMASGAANYRGTVLMIFDPQDSLRYASLINATEPTGIAIDTFGNIFIGGSSHLFLPNSTPFVDPGNGAFFQAEDNVARFSSNVSHIVKLTDSLTITWATAFGINPPNRQFSNTMTSIGIDKNQQLVTSFSVSLTMPNGTFLFDPGVGYFDNVPGNSTGFPANVGGDILIARFDNLGRMNWGTLYGDRLSETFTDVAINSENEYLFVGYASVRNCSPSSMTYRPDGGIAYYDGIGPTAGNWQYADWEDGLISRFSPNFLPGTSDTCVEETISGLLPVEWAYFEVQKASFNSATLTWGTQSELNNQQFEIERAGSDLVFEPISYVAGAGTTWTPQTYAYLDQGLAAGQYYYRLKQVDETGTFQYSDIKTVQIEASASSNMWWEATQLNIQLPEKANYIQVIDVSGRILHQQKVPSNNFLQVNLEALAAGVYFVQVMQDKQLIYNKKTVKVP